MLAALGLVVVGALRDGAPPLPDSVRIEDAPDTYRIAYEVESSGGPDRPLDVSTEVIEVDRPFRSLVASRTGRPPGGALTTGRISDLSRLLQFDGTVWKEVQLAPAMAGSDLRLDRVLDAMVRDGAVERRDEVRRIADRACQVYRLGGPVTAGSLPRVGSVAGEHADVCVDGDGLVLAEEWIADGELLRRRTAVDVAVGIDFDRDTFRVEHVQPVAATDGGGAAHRIADDATFGDQTWELSAPPDGFTFQGRWSVVWPRLEAAVDPFSAPTAGRVAGIATVWARGIDAIVVEQGGTHDGSAPVGPNPDGARVDLGRVGTGEVITDARGTEVRVVRDDGSFVRVWSTLPRARVLALARSLQARGR